MLASEEHRFTIKVLLRSRDVIWGFDFLDTKNLIYTERRGRLLVLNLETGETSGIEGAPPVQAEGQGGLLDVKTHPQFAANKKIFITFTKPVKNKMTTALASAQLTDKKLFNLQELFSAHEPNNNSHHFGSRIEFDRSGHIYISIGDRGERDLAQNLAYHNGKIVRLNENGSIPTDNPFYNNKSARPEIWSYGHRNPQGLATHPLTGQLWECEMGPRGGDEINLIKPGGNYGWPIITYGREYYGPKIGEGTHKKGMEQPVTYYVPSISPSGMSFYSGDKFPKWSANLFIAALSAAHLRRVVLQGAQIFHQEILLDKPGWRFRDVQQGPDGFIYFSTDEGLLARLEPAK